MLKNTDKILADELIKKGVLSQQNWEKYLAEIQVSNENLRDFLLRKNVATEPQILEALAAGFKLQITELRNLTIDKTVVDRVPVRFAWYYKIMPVRLEGKTVVLASPTVLDLKILDEMRVHLGLEPRLVLAKERDIIDALNKHYGLAADTINRIMVKEPRSAAAERSESVEDLEKDSDDASVSNLVNQIILQAYKKRATDIHIEPYRSKVRVRYRIDGVLIDANLPQDVRHFLPSIISRIKIMSNLSIVEKRLPQDGSTVVSTKEQDLDLRISTIPTPRGESMVIRILPSKVMVMSLEKLGLDQQNLRDFRELIQKPHGIILVTGPTGSGKTTTLYACLSEINSADVKIITIEDPIEYEMEGITQIQVNPKVNLTFAAGLRSILRHDPDAIMVGEIRDMETAEIAIRTALTGHLVLSTLHTNDAASGVTRLVDMGLEPFLVASSVEAFVAQRLVRIICPDCKEEVHSPLLEIKEEMGQMLDIPDQDKIKIYAGKGCDKCNFTGYYGRTAIHEVLVVKENIRAAILEKRGAEEIKQLAIRNGMTTLRKDGWRKVLAGVTTPAEIMNVTVKDEDPRGIPSSAVKPAELKPAARIVTKEVLAGKNDYNARVYPRAGLKVGIRYQILKQDATEPTRLLSDGVEHSSLTKDISAGGLRFVSGYTLPIGTLLELRIHLDKNERSIDCLAKICRVEDDNMSAMFNLVAYYLDVSSADRVRIDTFVRAHMDEKEPKESGG